MSHTHGIHGGSQQVYENRNVAAAAQTNGVARTSQTSATAQTASVGDDQAQLSGSSALVAPAASDVRSDKVAALQSQIAAGTYNVSSSDVADRVIGALLK